MHDRSVIVLGSGVSGLSTAIRLQAAGRQVEIWTAAPPLETTSSVAAAIWYPYRAYPQEQVLEWSRFSYEVFDSLARDPASGVFQRAGVELWRTTVSDPWWRDAVPGFGRCAPADLPPGYADGYVFTVPIVEMPVYLAYLTARFRAGGGRLAQRAVRSLDEVFERSATVVNCTGLGARALVGDDLLTPIRGQIVRTSNPGIDRAVLDEDDPRGLTYIVPRTGDCILGGTAEEGCWETVPDPDTANAILQRCVALEPRLRDADILEHKVGLRPGRPAVRLEREEFGRGRVCVHNYGHGGAGVTLSWGCAEVVADLVQEWSGEEPHLRSGPYPAHGG